MLTGHWIWPWEIDAVFPEDWQYAMLAIIDEVPKRRPKT
jgi:hypothetical protein